MCIDIINKTIESYTKDKNNFNFTALYLNTVDIIIDAAKKIKNKELKDNFIYDVEDIVQEFYLYLFTSDNIPVFYSQEEFINYIYKIIK